MNTFKTAILLAAMTALFTAVGFLLAGPRGMAVAFLLAAATNLFAYWNADKLVLRAYGAREVDARHQPELHRLLAELSARAGLPTPRAFLIRSAQPNAFATGRDPAHAAVAVTTGILQSLSRDELAGVLAHELAHIQHRDTLTMTVTATLAGAISTLGNFAFLFGGGNDRRPLGGIGALLAVLVAPIAAAVVQMAVSRSREYAADRRGAEICGEPLWLASALRRLAAGHEANPEAERHPATAHLFIVNPLGAARMDGLFSTHPNLANRIAALEAQATAMGRLAAPRGFDRIEADAGPSRAVVAASARRGTPGPWSERAAPRASRPTGPRTASRPKGPWG